MARVKYIDKTGEHTGSLTLGEYVHYGIDERFPVNNPTYMVWNNTEYEPFKRAINKKYNTECEKAWLV